MDSLNWVDLVPLSNRQYNAKCRAPWQRTTVHCLVQQFNRIILFSFLKQRPPKSMHNALKSSEHLEVCCIFIWIWQQNGNSLAVLMSFFLFLCINFPRCPNFLCNFHYSLKKISFQVFSPVKKAITINFYDLFFHGYYTQTTNTQKKIPKR